MEGSSERLVYHVVGTVSCHDLGLHHYRAREYWMPRGARARVDYAIGKHIGWHEIWILALMANP